MNQAVRPMRVGDHPVEDTFAPLHTPKQDARTNAVLDRSVVGNVVFGSGGGIPDAATTKNWDSPLPEHMLNTGKPRRVPSDGAIYSAVSREDERKRKAALAPVQQLGGMKIYLAGPMTGIPHFNFPAFSAAAKMLRAHGHTVFNPAEHDVIRHGVDISIGNETGDPALAIADHGFSLRDALGADTHFICKEADAIAMLPGWENSKGARAEHALAFALGHQILYLGGFYA